MNEKDLNDLCIAAARKMLDEGINRHETFVQEDDFAGIPYSFPSREILKVTIEWADASEAQPKGD